MAIWACKSTTKRSNKKQKGHASASPASSTPFTLDSVSLGQDSESLTNQDRLNGQKTIKKWLKRK
jgi:hypothetical protein